MSRPFFKNKSGQAIASSSSSSAAFLLLMIMLLIIFYILFLPPTERAELLDDNVIPGTPVTSSGGYSHLLGTSALDITVGHIDYISQAEIEHALSSFRIYTQTDARLIQDVSSLYVKNSAFETKTKQIDFAIDKEAAQNVQVSFNVFRPSGTLSVYLNGVQLLEGTLQEGSPAPIVLPQHVLKNQNVLFFTVSSPGFAFWRVNEYELHNVRITGDITDDSNSFNMQKIYLADNEYNHMKQAEFSFFPDCTMGEVGNMGIHINGNQVYYGTPDCGITNRMSVSKDNLVAGENRFEFISEAGSYIIDMPELEVDLEDPQYPIYYFDLHEDLFTQGEQQSTFCGKVDGICPDNCQPYDDKDCCFDQSNQNYWCDVQTDNPFDRCVNMVLASYVNNCPTGYENTAGEPHDDAVGLCGDDTDGNCPPGCSQHYDKDCCFEISGSYWCEDIPLTGEASVCKQVVTPAQCSACPERYHNEDNEEPNCAGSTLPTYYTDPVLKAGVDVVLDVYFTDDEYHKVDFNINGNILPMDTYNINVKRNINIYVREGSNSMVIQPRKDVDIAQMRVRIE